MNDKKWFEVDRRRRLLFDPWNEGSLRQWPRLPTPDFDTCLATALTLRRLERALLENWAAHNTLVHDVVALRPPVRTRFFKVRSAFVATVERFVKRLSDGPTARLTERTRVAFRETLANDRDRIVRAAHEEVELEREMARLRREIDYYQTLPIAENERLRREISVRRHRLVTIESYVKYHHNAQQVFEHAFVRMLDHALIDVARIGTAELDQWPHITAVEKLKRYYTELNEVLEDERERTILINAFRGASSSMTGNASSSSFSSPSSS